MKWFQRAAFQGHPLAVLTLAETYVHSRNLSCAQTLAWKAAELWGDSDWRRFCFEYLVCLAEELAADGSDEGLHEAGAILRDIAKDAKKVDLNAEYCDRAIEILQRNESVDSRSACARLSSRLFYLGHPQFAPEASAFHLAAREPALGMMWFSVSRKVQQHTSGSETPALWEQPLRVCWSDLRNIRNACAGCGAVLEGDMRKMCRRCRTYCYCSRECQGLHWNRAIYGHREECMEVAAEMCKLLAAIKNGQLQLP